MSKIVITVKGGLNPEQRLYVLELAVAHHFRYELGKLQPDLSQAAVAEIARDLARRMDQCGAGHLSEAAPPMLCLTPPSADECAALEAVIKETIDLRIVNATPKQRRGPVARWVILTTGVIWSKLYKRLSGNEVPPEPTQGNHAGGIRG
jgi:hypothetical protein